MHRGAVRAVGGLVLAIAAVGVAPSASVQAFDSPFQVSFATDLAKRPTQISISNSGASSTVASPTQNGAVCANIYAFAIDGPMIDCCSCLVGANNVKHLSVATDVLDDRRPVPKAVVLKMMGTVANGGSCNAATAGASGNVLAIGLLAWKEDEHFTPATLSAAELASINNQCTVLRPAPHTCAVCQ